jgi:hypothetical protein
LNLLMHRRTPLSWVGFLVDLGWFHHRVQYPPGCHLPSSHCRALWMTVPVSARVALWPGLKVWSGYPAISLPPTAAATDFLAHPEISPPSVKGGRVRRRLRQAVPTGEWRGFLLDLFDLRFAGALLAAHRFVDEAGWVIIEETHIPKGRRDELC